MTLRHDGGCYAIISADIWEYRSHRSARYYNGNNHNKSGSIRYCICVQIKNEKSIIFKNEKSIIFASINKRKKILNESMRKKRINVASSLWTVS